jgi:hypothetical protein
LTAAGYNVRINVASLSDLSAGQEFLDQLLALEAQALETESSIRETLQERGGFSTE